MSDDILLHVAAMSVAVSHGHEPYCLCVSLLSYQKVCQLHQSHHVLSPNVAVEMQLEMVLKTGNSQR